MACVRNDVVERMRTSITMGLGAKVLSDLQRVPGQEAAIAQPIADVMIRVACAKHWYRNLLLVIAVVSCVLVGVLFATGLIRNGTLVQSSIRAVFGVTCTLGLPMLAFRGLAHLRYGKHVKPLLALIQSERVTQQEWIVVKNTTLRNPHMHRVRGILEALEDGCDASAGPPRAR